jgi:hypothetical protein
MIYNDICCIKCFIGVVHFVLQQEDVKEEESNKTPLFVLLLHKNLVMPKLLNVTTKNYKPYLFCYPTYFKINKLGFLGQVQWIHHPKSLHGFYRGLPYPNIVTCTYKYIHIISECTSI